MRQRTRLIGRLRQAAAKFGDAQTIASARLSLGSFKQHQATTMKTDAQLQQDVMAEPIEAELKRSAGVRHVVDKMTLVY